ncbi:MAG TPA: GNAT family N-acetyltransferase [Pyrinomonadaceae bacterium]|nr:GNAT family N-acetyltransferase [Pyrinomonadaceae bacterium]
MSEAAFQREVSIRRATAEDVVLLSTLSSVTFYEAYFEQDDPHDLSNYLRENFGRETIEAEMEHSAYFIAFRRGRAVGYAKLRDGEPHEAVKGNAVELQRIYLVERVWGTGIGDTLLEICMEEARSMGKDVLWLGVWEENRRGLSFYAKHGFTRVGTLTFPYCGSVGINAVMQISL